MGGMYINFLAVVGAGTSALVLLTALWLGLRWLKKRRVPARVLLTLDLDHGIAEAAPTGTINRLRGPGQPLLLTVLQALDRASRDRRVMGLFVRMGSAHLGMAQCQELREAFQTFAKSGKACVAFANSFPNSNAGTRSYYLATACSKVYAQPTGEVGLCGMEARAFFVKALLERFAIKAQFEKRSEYKTAMNMLLEEGFTEEHRESLEGISHSFMEQTINGIAESRCLDVKRVRAILDEGPFSAPEALEKGLIDGVVYEDEVFDTLRDKPGKTLKTLSLMQYHSKAWRPPRARRSVGLIYGTGPVVDGESGHSFLYRGSSMGAKTLARAFRQAVKHKSVAAIVFRVDSPGGSYVASDTIWREVCRAQEKGKPVIVSMGDVAGSGGYFVAMPARYIVAQPGTITGSIGVLAGKLVTREAWSRLGVSWDEVRTHANAGMWSDTSEFTPEQAEKLREMMDRAYSDFTDRVGQHRNASAEEVDANARGRIFTGVQAKERKLIDHLGGLKLALDLARREIGAPEDKELPVRVFPPRPSLMEKIAQKTTELPEVQLAAFGSIKELEPIFRAVSLLGKKDKTVSLEMPHPQLWTEL